VQALSQKLRDAFTQPGAELSEIAQVNLVRAYFDGIREVSRLSEEITQVFADPEIGNHAAAAAPLQARLDDLKRVQEMRRPAAERIIQGQIGAVAEAQQLLTLGSVFPPVVFLFAESPDVLVISPRDHIRVADIVDVNPDLSVERKETIEQAVEARLGVSALVEETGGLGAYPTMVIEHSNLPWVLTIVAHEWIHNYLTLRPLGFNYFASGDLRTLNETVAEIAGNELGGMAYQRYYREALEEARVAGHVGRASGLAAPAPFDFYRTMHDTRVRVDELLAHGKVDEAEAYMEAQRQVLLEHGYYIRRLNQAYFAFHGSYAVGVGAAGADPIGDKLRRMRERSASLADFMNAVSQVTSVAELDALLAASE